MKRIFFYLIALLFTTTSCLEWGLDDLPAYENAEMTAFSLEHRYVTTNANGVEKLAIATLTTTQVIDTATNTITITPSIPAPSGSFTQDERRRVRLDSIVGYCTVSTAAKVTPLNGAPALGTIGDFTQPRQYKVTAADGKTSKTWTIVVKELPLINQYEGAYHSTGYFQHPSSPRAIDRNKYLSSVDANTVSCEHSDLGTSGYSMKLTINSDNSVTVYQFYNGSTLGEMTPGESNYYDPATKTFVLHYRYLGGTGYRTINETIVLK